MVDNYKSYAALNVRGSPEDFYSIARITEGKGGSVEDYMKQGNLVSGTLVMPFQYAGMVMDKIKRLGSEAKPLNQFKTYDESFFM